MPALGHPRRHLESVASTMDEAAAWAQAGAPHGALLTTDHQTGGRGRLGRTWTDTPGDSLLASLILRPSFSPDRLGLVPLAAGLAIADAVGRACGTPDVAHVKWPNDVLIRGRKVAGVLTEATHGPDGPTVIVGVGINVSQTAFPDELASRAASLRQLVGAVDREALLGALLDELARQLDALATLPVSAFIDRFEARMASRGQQVTVTGASGAQTGAALGIAPDGALRLQVDGPEQRVYAGDVTLASPDRFLAVDVGNSTVKAGLWDGTAWTLARWPTAPETPSEVWAERLSAFAPGVRAGGLVSVVPAVGDALDAAVRQLEVSRWSGHVRPDVLAPDAPVTPAEDLELATTGSDRFAAVAGGVRLAAPGQSVVVVCAGTAVTVEGVRAGDARWTWLGGAIAPGPDLLRHSLPDHTAALPLVDWPEGAVGASGRSTPEAMQAGLAGLYAGGVAELVGRARAALPGAPLVVATGGWAPWLAAHTDAIVRVEPTLILDGVRELAARRIEGPR